MNKLKNVQLVLISTLNGVIKKLKLHSATGNDNIHNLMIKNSSNNFKNIRVQLINLTAELEKLPQCWKESVITMIPKKKVNSDNPKDYRQISLTSNLAK
jgi:hypothetical protein